MLRQRFSLTLCAVAAIAAPALSQESGTSLEILVQNGAPSQARAVKSPTPPSRSSRTLPPLPSRGTVTRRELRPSGQPAPKKVLARVGTVTAERVEIRTATSGGQVLSVVTYETNLAVMQETDTHYGVLMSNGAMGWLPKDAVALIDYNTEVAVPGSAEPTTASQPGLEGLQPQERTVLQEALTYLGVPYVWAGNTRNGLDCSGFVKNVYKTIGVNLPRHSGDQARVGQPVSGEALRPGDRLYFAMKGGAVSHCGIYLGNGYFIHASTNHHRVAVDPIYRDSHYAKKLVAIRR